MTVLWFALVGFAFLTFACVRLLFTALRWSREFKELQANGVETTGTVTRKLSFNRKGPRSRYIRYEYRDQFGQAHTRKTIVVGDAWEQHQEGGPITVVYSQRMPKVSAAKFLFDVMVKAAHEKRVTRSGTV